MYQFETLKLTALVSSLFLLAGCGDGFKSAGNSSSLNISNLKNEVDQVQIEQAKIQPVIDKAMESMNTTSMPGNTELPQMEALAAKLKSINSLALPINFDELHAIILDKISTCTFALVVQDADPVTRIGYMNVSLVSADSTPCAISINLRASFQEAISLPPPVEEDPNLEELPPLTDPLVEPFILNSLITYEIVINDEELKSLLGYKALNNKLKIEMAEATSVDTSQISFESSLEFINLADEVKLLSHIGKMNFKLQNPDVMLAVSNGILKINNNVYSIKVIQRINIANPDQILLGTKVYINGQQVEPEFFNNLLNSTNIAGQGSSSNNGSVNSPPEPI